MTPDRPPGPWLLAIDTATSRIVVAAGAPDGRAIRALDWPAGHRHGERLLPGVEQLVAETGLARENLAGIVAGTGPGAFTGLRVGLATAKALAHATGVPIAGVGTGEALIRAAVAAGVARPGRVVLLLPAGPHDRVAIRDGDQPELLPGGTEPAMGRDDVLIAVDLPGRAPEEAVARGEAARAGLAEALLALGAERLATGTSGDVELVVPEYVTLPRGVRATSGEIEWSHGPR
ncbi:MAG TPA: tRNA (adenosine(37)-N6)-threonylcarbamoyltransferase complex dimerization subunit type 1 TsaB [Candidatus Sulfomarinibacteraceae bacterium]|nr:tRNA (adenosine(37)-N6)-threonylcarbamoyltransferase complex dimerization subunit type 1 TsaB [Candidatus Sulfomarinibacteraceae bacterium]